MRFSLPLLISALAICLLPSPSWASDNEYEHILKVGVDFDTISDAVSTLSSFRGESVLISIKPGIYKEQVRIDYKGKVALVNTSPDEQVTIKTSLYHDLKSGRGTHNIDFSTMIVRNAQLYLQNISLVNEPKGHGPAQALFIDARSSVTMQGVTIASHQDTLYVSGGSRAYCYKCSIYGDVDFLYGSGTLIIESSSIYSIGRGAVTAWRGGFGYKGSTKGCYVFNSWLGTTEEAASKTKGNVWLGRPWDDQAVSVWVNTYFDVELARGMWKRWQESDPRVSSHTTFIDIGSTGPGVQGVERTIGKELPYREAAKFRVGDLWGQLDS